MKYHILIISDLHLWFKNMRNRKNSVKDNLETFNKIIERVKKCRRENPKDIIYLVFLGDIFHQGFDKSTEMFNLWIQQFSILRSLCNGIFLVMGNHEWSYRLNNPFWSLINEVESEKLRNRGATANGLLPICRLTDKISIDGIDLHFLHHNTNFSELTSEKNILFSHGYWMTKNTFDSLIEKAGMETQSKYSEYNSIEDNEVIIKNFQYAFFGHMHMLKGKTKIEWDSDFFEPTTFYYLASLGLTEVNEVLKLDGIRLLPEIVIENGEVNVIDHEIEIPHGEEILKMKVVQDNKEKYEVMKEKKKLKEITMQEVCGDNPIEEIVEELMAEGNTMALELFQSLKIEGACPEWLSKMN